MRTSVELSGRHHAGFPTRRARPFRLPFSPVRPATGRTLQGGLRHLSNPTRWDQVGTTHSHRPRAHIEHAFASEGGAWSRRVIGPAAAYARHLCVLREFPMHFRAQLLALTTLRWLSSQTVVEGLCGHTGSSGRRPFTTRGCCDDLSPILALPLVYRGSYAQPESIPAWDCAPSDGGSTAG